MLKSDTIRKNEKTNSYDKNTMKTAKKYRRLAGFAWKFLALRLSGPSMTCLIGDNHSV